MNRTNLPFTAPAISFLPSGSTGSCGTFLPEASNKSWVWNSCLSVGLADSCQPASWILSKGGSRNGAAVQFGRRRGYHGWACQRSATRTRDWRFWSRSCLRHLPTSANGGSAYPLTMFQFRESSSMPSAWGSSLQLSNRCCWVARRVAKRSTSRGPRVDWMWKTLEDQVFSHVDLTSLWTPFPPEHWTLLVDIWLLCGSGAVGVSVSQTRTGYFVPLFTKRAAVILSISKRTVILALPLVKAFLEMPHLKVPVKRGFCLRSLTSCRSANAKCSPTSLGCIGPYN